MGRKSYLAGMLVFLSVFSLTVLAAGEVELLTGKINTSISKNGISLFLLDLDGSILDISTPKADGTFEFDVTVMDEPVYRELIKLKLRVKNKSGKVKELKIAKQIEQFVDKKVKLEPFSFP